MNNTYRGKPAASMLPLTEDDLEDFIIEHSPSIRKRIKKARDDIRKGRVISLDDYLSRGYFSKEVIRPKS